MTVFTNSIIKALEMHYSARIIRILTNSYENDHALAMEEFVRRIMGEELSERRVIDDVVIDFVVPHIDFSSVVDHFRRLKIDRIGY